MEIKNYTSVINAYRYNADAAASVKSRTVKTRANTDKAEFSKNARASFSDTLKTAAKAAADSSASAERLNALSAQIADGTYDVSPEDVAASILGM